MKITPSQLFRQKPVNIERTQHIGHYGVIFTVMRFAVMPGNSHVLVSPERSLSTFVRQYQGG